MSMSQLTQVHSCQVGGTVATKLHAGGGRSLQLLAVSSVSVSKVPKSKVQAEQVTKHFEDDLFSE